MLEHYSVIVVLQTVGETMNQDNLTVKVDRDLFDRRNGHHIAPPYLTDEGFVLVDRRTSPERRVDAQRSLVVNLESAIKPILG